MTLVYSRLRVGIDASNIRTGGGITHLVELLNAANPLDHGIDHVVVFVGRKTAERIAPRPWLTIQTESLLDRSLFFRVFWQKYYFEHKVSMHGINLIFVPGGYSAIKEPFVAMSQNMLPFQYEEMFRYGLSLDLIRLFFIRLLQKKSFKKAEGVIFLSEFAKQKIITILKKSPKRVAHISHGVGKQFFVTPRKQKHPDEFNKNRLFRLVYLSIIDVYKHHEELIQAVIKLRQEGLPISLELFGPACCQQKKSLHSIITKYDPSAETVFYRGEVSHCELPAVLSQADAFVFASSCENFPNILLESMAAGLPIACSNLGPMPEILSDAGIYFNPNKVSEIMAALKMIFEDVELRERISSLAFNMAKNYSWERCAFETWQFISSIGSPILEKEV